jgi:hypothetical protein
VTALELDLAQSVQGLCKVAVPHVPADGGHPTRPILRDGVSTCGVGVTGTHIVSSSVAFPNQALRVRQDGRDDGPLSQYSRFSGNLLVVSYICSIGTFKGRILRR